MKTIKPLFFVAALLMLGAVGAQEPEVVASNTHESFSLTAPTEFRGVWNRQFQPFVNPVDMQSWANVRVEAFDATSGNVTGHFDFYVRSICNDVVDQPFNGTFDGKTLRLSYEFTQCPRMKPLRLALWKEPDGFHGRTMGLPITINKVIYPPANP